MTLFAEEVIPKLRKNPKSTVEKRLAMAGVR